MDKPKWENTAPTWHPCDLCSDEKGAYFGHYSRAQSVVWLCTDCAEALADVVNERRPDPEIGRLRQMVAKLVGELYGRSKVGWGDWKEEWPEEAAVVEAMYPEEYGQEAVDDGHPG